MTVREICSNNENTVTKQLKSSQLDIQCSHNIWGTLIIGEHSSIDNKICRL